MSRWRAITTAASQRETGVGLGETLVVTGATGDWCRCDRGGAAIGHRQGDRGFADDGKSRAYRRLGAGMRRAAGPRIVPRNWRETRALASAIRDLAGPQGVAGFADFLPAEGAATAQGILALRRAGHAVLSGGNRETLALPYGAFRLEFLSVLSSNGFERSDAIDLMNAIRAGRYDVGRMITNCHPLKDVNEAVADIDQRRGNPLLIAIDGQPPGASAHMSVMTSAISCTSARGMPRVTNCSKRSLNMALVSIA
jgi:hypothetical protein